jgi:type II secretory pathway pseudopilin PulG
MKTKINFSGFSLVEIIIGSAILATSIVAIIGVMGWFTELAPRTTPRLQASFLAEEGIEAVRTIRDRGWTTDISPLNNNTAYYLNWNGTAWRATTTFSMVDNQFVRTFELDPVYRDGSFDIAESGSSDANSRLVTVNVSWFDKGATSTKTLQSYIFNTQND